MVLPEFILTNLVHKSENGKVGVTCTQSCTYCVLQTYPLELMANTCFGSKGTYSGRIKVGSLVERCSLHKIVISTKCCIVQEALGAESIWYLCISPPPPPPPPPVKRQVYPQTDMWLQTQSHYILSANY